MSKILVTGGTGLIGMYAVQQLVALGHDVVVADVSPRPEALGDAASKVEIIRGDISETGFFGRTIKAHGIERVLHLAAVLTVEAVTDPVKAMRVNLLASAELLEQAWIQDLEKVCIASSVSVYGPPSMYENGEVDEDDLPAPADPYPLSKRGIEIMIERFREVHGLDAVAVRPPVTFGPGRYTSFPGQLNMCLKDVALGRPATFPAWPGSTIQALMAQDMADTFVKATLSGRTEEYIFNGPTSPAHPIPEIVQMIKNVVPDAQIEVLEGNFKGLNTFPFVKGERAIEILGSVPQFSMQDAIAWMIEHFRAGGE